MDDDYYPETLIPAMYVQYGGVVRSKYWSVELITLAGDLSHLLWCEIEGVYPSGQRGQTVNLMAKPSQVRILPPPFIFAALN